MNTDNRRFNNLVIAPLLQGKIISQVIIISALFTGGMLYYINSIWNGAMIALAPQESQEFIRFFTVLAIGMTFQFLAVTVLLIVHTHRFLGAAFAIGRYLHEHLLQGHFEGQIVLRKNDYLVDLADDVNRLSVKLAQEEIRRQQTLT